MLFIVITMLVIVAVAGLVVAFVAFPHRGEELPGVPWLGDAMNNAVDAMPTLDGESDEGGPVEAQEPQDQAGSEEPGAHR